MAAKLIALAVLAIVSAATFAIFWLIARRSSPASNKQRQFRILFIAILALSLILPFLWVLIVSGPDFVYADYPSALITEIKLLMPIVVGVGLFSVVLLIGRLFVIFAKRYAASDRHWAYATVGTVLRLLFQHPYPLFVPCLAVVGLLILCVMLVLTRSPFYGWAGGTHAVNPCTSPDFLSRGGRVLATDRYNDPDAYSVYSVIVPTFAPNDKLGVWLIRRETVPLYSSSSWLLENRFNLPKPILCRLSKLLSGEDCSSYRLVSADELSKMFSDSQDPSAEDWVELSEVGFNADKTSAVVYMEHWCTASCCCGEGNGYELKKNFFGRWQVTEQYFCWIS